MSEPGAFDFGSSSVASAYDDVLAPILFEPWAALLLAEHSHWQGARVLDLATGTGVVAEALAGEVGLDGEVIGADINPEMLALAESRCADLSAVSFIESPAEPLGLDEQSVDVVVCQQGFQFFPDRNAAASEIHRVLQRGGVAIATTWRPVAECEFFGILCDALVTIGEAELAATMRVPFDHMPAAELGGHFVEAGFESVAVDRHTLDFVLERGPEQALEVAYSTPIGPQLAELSEDLQAGFREALVEFAKELSDDGVTMGRMVSNVVRAKRPE
ncbi:MAG: class I SAM-dependent methyltransferase [Acidimicrobiia bacterium]